MTPTQFIILMLSFGVLTSLGWFIRSKPAQKIILNWIETMFVGLLWLMIIPIALICKLFEKDKNEKN